MTFDDLIGPLLEREGGGKYTDRPSDRGGPTKYGITQTTFSRWLAKRVQPYRDVETLTRDEAVKIYLEEYWTVANCSELPTQLRELQFDAAVQHSPRRAVMLLQEAAGVRVDGSFGPATLKAVSAMNQDLLFYRYVAARYRFYGAIINRDRTQLDNICGWMSRMEAFA